MKLAVIDIGTNSTLLLIVAQEGSKIRPLVDLATITRMGEGIGTHGIFSPDGLKRTFECLRKYKQLCVKEKAEPIFAVGTAAFRKAKNALEFIKFVQEELGILIEIISGEKEGELNWCAAIRDFGEGICVVDVGGGSTEIISRSSPDYIDVVSLPIGSVYLTEKFCHSDPISPRDFQNMEAEILSQLQQQTSQAGKRCVATAGTATTLAAMQKKLIQYQHSEIHGSALTLEQIEAMIQELKMKSIEERKTIPGLEPKRADVILAGAMILRECAKQLGQTAMTVSDRGVRWGLAYDFFRASGSVPTRQ